MSPVVKQEEKKQIPDKTEGDLLLHLQIRNSSNDEGTIYLVQPHH